MTHEITLAEALGEAGEEPAAAAVTVGGTAYKIYPLRLRDYGRIQRATGEADLALGTLDGMAAAVWCNMRRTDPALEIDDVEALFDIQDAASMEAFTTMFARVMRASGLTGSTTIGGGAAGTAKNGAGARQEASGAKLKASRSAASA